MPKRITKLYLHNIQFTICKFDLFQLYGEYFDKEMFEYVLNLIYNLPKSEASVVYSEMTVKPNEIRLGNAFF